jgi:hypothetical protein
VIERPSSWANKIGKVRFVRARDAAGINSIRIGYYKGISLETVRMEAMYDHHHHR